jgi:hypothetical protein
MWRFTPERHEYLFASAGFEMFCSATWGGSAAVQMVSLGLGMLPVSRWPEHPVRKIAEKLGSEWPVASW